MAGITTKKAQAKVLAAAVRLFEAKARRDAANRDLAKAEKAYQDVFAKCAGALPASKSAARLPPPRGKPLPSKRPPPKAKATTPKPSTGRKTTQDEVLVYLARKGEPQTVGQIAEGLGADRRNTSFSLNGLLTRAKKVYHPARGMWALVEWRERLEGKSPAR